MYVEGTFQGAMVHVFRAVGNRWERIGSASGENGVTKIFLEDAVAVGRRLEGASCVLQLIA